MADAPGKRGNGVERGLQRGLVGCDVGCGVRLWTLSVGVLNGRQDFNL